MMDMNTANTITMNTTTKRHRRRTTSDRDLHAVACLLDRRTAACSTRRIRKVRIFILAILAFALCSCADSYEILGLHLKPAAEGDYDNAGHVPGSGDPE